MQQGKRFGQWTVIGERDDGKVRCRCDCGTVRSVALFKKDTILPPQFRMVY